MQPDTGLLATVPACKKAVHISWHALHALASAVTTCFARDTVAHTAGLLYFRGFQAGDYVGGAAWEGLLQHLMEAHQPLSSPTDKATLEALPRRKVRPAGAATKLPSSSDTDLDAIDTEATVGAAATTQQPHYAACTHGEPCSVCHDELSDTVVELPCKHCYHEDCIVSWLKEVCL